MSALLAATAAQRHGSGVLAYIWVGFLGFACGDIGYQLRELIRIAGALGRRHFT